MVFAILGVVAARYLPWRGGARRGIALWFPFGRCLFLPREAVTVRVGTKSAVAHPEAYRRFGYPLTDGPVERRHAALQVVLVEHGFRLA